MQEQSPSASSRRLALRVATKLLGLVALLAFVYVLVSSAFAPGGQDAAEQLAVDLQGLRAGEVKQVQWDGRLVLVLHRSALMLEALRRDAEAVLIRVAADPARSLARVRTREGREHVDVSDGQVEALNAAVLARTHPFAGTLENDDATPASLLAAFAAIRESGTRPAE